MVLDHGSKEGAAELTAAHLDGTSNRNDVMKRTLLLAMLVPLLAIVACSDSHRHVTAPDDALHHHNPGHPGGPGGGGGGGGDDPVSYVAQVIDAGSTFPGTNRALGIDDQGTVVGRGGPAPDGQPGGAFRWEDGIGDLQRVPGTDPGSGSAALAIDRGLITGWHEGRSVEVGDRTHFLTTPFLYSTAGLRNLDHLDRIECIDGSHSSESVAIATWGSVGTSTCTIDSPEGSPERSERPVVWLAADDYQPHQLPLQESDSFRRVRDVNDVGVVLGSLLRDGRAIAVEWTVSESGEITGPLERPRGSTAAALAINNDGDIVGPVGARAELVTASGTVVSLERLRQGDGSIIPYDLTARIDGIVRVVGTSGDRAAVWTVDAARGEVVSSQYLDMPEGNYSRAHARAINADGWVAGYARDLDADREVAMLWKPVGDPGDPTPPPPNGDLQASFTYDCSNGSTCQFTDTSTGDPDTWSWTFSGGTPADANTQDDASTMYQSAGTYTVSLEVTRGDEKSDVEQDITCRQQASNLRCR